MKPDYKNWVPKSMVAGLAGGTVLVFLLFFLLGATGLILHGTPRLICGIVFGLGTLILLFFTIWMTALHRTFDYNGKRKLAETIIDGIAEKVSVPDGGTGLDVGCGSGALTIACARRNPGAEFLGIDRWGKEYASFNKPLCEANARAEGVHNARFDRGDATALDFPDESFDAVVSNYVYHNIPVKDRQAILLETLRVLKKGGVFALHDIYSQAKYGDMQAFVRKLKEMGFKKVELIDTTKGKFMSPWESKWMGLSGSGLLIGRK